MYMIVVSCDVIKLTLWCDHKVDFNSAEYIKPNYPMTHSISYLACLALKLTVQLC